MSASRSPEVVLDDHLTISLTGNIDQDLERNYASDVVVVSNWGIAHGHDGVRDLADLLRRQLPDCTFTYRMRVIEDGIGMLAWSATSPAGSVGDGVDSYVITDGLIRAQTIHYTLNPPQ